MLDIIPPPHKWCQKWDSLKPRGRTVEEERINISDQEGGGDVLPEMDQQGEAEHQQAEVPNEPEDPGQQDLIRLVQDLTIQVQEQLVVDSGQTVAADVGSIEI